MVIKNKYLLVIAFLWISFVLGFRNVEVEINTLIVSITSDGDICLDISKQELQNQGIEQADIARMVLNGKEYLVVVNYDSELELNPGKDYIKSDGEKIYIVRKYRSFADKEELGKDCIGDSVQITLVEKNAYVYELQDASGLDKKVAANFRYVKAGGLGAGTLYRSCSPTVTDYGEERRSAADRLLREYRIDYVINLSENLAEMSERVAETYPQSNYNKLIEEGKVSAIALDWTDIDNPEYIDKIAEHFRFIAEHEGSYLIHCAIGQDRTGFVVEVLASLMGASYDELIQDYGMSFENYYKVERGSVLYQYLTEGGLRDSLEIMAGNSNIESYIGDDGKQLSQLAEKYLIRLGLTEEEISGIKTNLSKKGEFGPDTISCEKQVASELNLELKTDLAYYKGDIAGTIEVTNNGAAITDINGSFPLHIGISLLNAKGEILNQDYKRLELGEDGFPAADQITIDYADSIRDGSAHGIRVALVQEGVDWLHNYVEVRFDSILADDSAWQARLYSPTQIVKCNGCFLMEDCWHHRIIYTDSLSKPIEEWYVLTDDVMGGHSIACDGKSIVVDDTDHDEILVFELADIDGSEYIDPVQIIDVSPYVSRYTGNNHTARPHYVLYDEDKDIFLVPLSWGDKVLIFKKKKSREGMQLEYMSEYELEDSAYIKFISYFDGGYWIQEGNSLAKLEWIDNELKKTDEISLPDQLIDNNLNYVCKIKDTYYLSSWEESGLYTCQSLKELERGEMDNVGNKIGVEGIPYYISSFNDSYWICEIEPENGVIRFETDQHGMALNSDVMYSFGKGEKEDLLIKRLDDVIA